MKQDPVPAELQSWVDEQVQALHRAASELQSIADEDGLRPGEWGLALLPELIEAELRAKRTTHLITSWLLRNRHASPTAIARESSMTITGVQGRANSAVALDTWNEVWPPKS